VAAKHGVAFTSAACVMLTQPASRGSYSMGPRTHTVGSEQGGDAVEWIVLIVLVILLLGAAGPRAGWYGAGSALWDLLSLIVAIVLIVWVLRLLNVLVF
jgi:hypothetical protein